MPPLTILSRRLFAIGSLCAVAVGSMVSSNANAQSPPDESPECSLRHAGIDSGAGRGRCPYEDVPSLRFGRDGDADP